MLKSKNIVISLGILILISCYAQEIKPDAPISDSPSSSEVLSKALSVYQNLTSYQDEGIAATSISGKALSHSSELRFTTAFTKAGEFRFEYREPSLAGGETRYVVWKNGSDVKSWWTVDPNVKSGHDIGNAISGATGVSLGTAYTIPSVLMEEAAWKGNNWTSAAETYRIADAVDRVRIVSAFNEELQARLKPITAMNHQQPRG